MPTTCHLQNGVAVLVGRVQLQDNFGIVRPSSRDQVERLFHRPFAVGMGRDEDTCAATHQRVERREPLATLVVADAGRLAAPVAAPNRHPRQRIEAVV